MNKSLIKKPIFLAIFGLLFFILLLFLFYSTIKIEQSVEEEIQQISTSDIFAVARNKAVRINKLLKNSSNYVEDIKQSQDLQKDIEVIIKDLITPNIKYTYVLYKDEKGIFRFLIDASSGQDKALLNQKFDIDSPKWLDIYQLKQPMIIKHTLLQKLSLSYVIPIIYEKEVSFLLVVDFSIQKMEHVNRITNLMKSGLLLMIVLIIMFFMIYIIQFLRYKKIKYSSVTDKLTKVYNRNYLHEIEGDLELNEFILAAVDIDHFKRINDKYGHDIGDEVLKEIGQVMLQTLRKDEDIIIRYGGEEFVILIKRQENNILFALNVLNRLFYNLRRHSICVSEHENIMITVSIGVNIEPEISNSFMEAFKLADKVLYKAKNSGRDCIKIHGQK